MSRLQQSSIEETKRPAIRGGIDKVNTTTHPSGGTSTWHYVTFNAENPTRQEVTAKTVTHW
jgi:hypothetical protein